MGILTLLLNFSNNKNKKKTKWNWCHFHWNGIFLFPFFEIRKYKSSMMWTLIWSMHINSKLYSIVNFKSNISLTRFTERSVNVTTKYDTLIIIPAAYRNCHHWLRFYSWWHKIELQMQMPTWIFITGRTECSELNLNNTNVTLL